MKKLPLYIFVLLILPVTTMSGQSYNTRPHFPNIVKRDQNSNATKGDSVQAGTVSIENGKTVIKLTNKIDNSGYDVSIIPQCNNCGQIMVSEKGEQSFTVQQTGGSGGAATIRYVVYKQKPLQTNTIINQTDK